MTTETAVPITSAQLEAMFPDVDHGITPQGHRVLVQFPVEVDRVGSILLADDTIDAQKWNRSAAKVIALGGGCYTQYRGAGNEWSTGPFCEPGDFVLVPRSTADRIHIMHPPIGKEVAFALIQDETVLAKTSDPTRIRAYVGGAVA